VRENKTFRATRTDRTNRVDDNHLLCHLGNELIIGHDEIRPLSGSPPIGSPFSWPISSRASRLEVLLDGRRKIKIEVRKQLQAALHDSRRLVAKAASLVSNYSQPER
jgi:hypothetical protein